MIFSVIMYVKDNTKVCKKCQEEKVLTEFYKHKIFKDGRRAICKCCTKKYVEENSGTIKKYQKEYYKKNEGEIKKKVKEWAEVPQATQIMAADHYGWFTRVSRGVYDLTEVGHKGLADYGDV